MRSFARWLLIGVTLASGSAAYAQQSTPRALYTEALGRERAIRTELERASADPTLSSVLRRLRSVVAAYERMSRQYPASGYMDNALWQGALLAADAFWKFGQPADKATALRMFSALSARFPTSSLITQTPPHVKRLRDARPAPPARPPAARSAAAKAPVPRTPASGQSPLTAPATSPAPGAVTLTAIRRDVLPEALRITVELGREVTYHADRLDGPPRVFIDFDDTEAVEALADATLPFPDDVVERVRVGRQPESRTRVVMDLAAAGQHSIYTLYNPFRVVVDFQRASGLAAGPADGTEPVLAALARDEGRTGGAPAAPEAPSGSASAAVNRAEPIAPPAPPDANTSGRFSLSRQLGLGVSRIVIDPGHGGHDPGAKTRGLTEADLVLDVALRLEQLLSKHDGFEVVLTRRVDTFVPLEERTAIANREAADLFLSIHANASANTAARGVETYFLNLTTNPEAAAVAARENAASARNMSQLPDIVKAIALNNKIDESRDFASMIQTALASQLQKTDGRVRDLGVKQAPFMVLLGATMPSVLAEISFITNREDAALLSTAGHRQRIAQALYAGVVRYQQSLKRAPAIAEQ